MRWRRQAERSEAMPARTNDRERPGAKKIQASRPIREVYKGTWQENFSFSPLIKTQGGTTLYLAGVGVPHGGAGKALDFEGQVRATFEAMRAELARAGGTLDDVVTMTVFVNDIRNGK